MVAADPTTMSRTVRLARAEGEPFTPVLYAEVRGAVRGLWSARGTRTRLVVTVRGATVEDLQRVSMELEREAAFDGADVSVNGSDRADSVVIIVQRRDESAAWEDRKRGVRGGRR